MDIDDSFNVRVDLLRKSKGDTNSCFQIQYSQLPIGDNLKIGEVLIQNLWFGVVQSLQNDINEKFQVGDTLKGPTVSKVLFSRSADFNIGDIVNGSFNWEKYLIVVDDQISKSNFSEALSYYQLGPRSIDGLVAVNALGQAKPKPGQTIVITNASYGVGFILIKLSSHLGCNVVAIVNNEDQGSFLNLNGFRGHIVQKRDLFKTLNKVFIKGVDVIIDSEGGPILDSCISYINTNARIILTNYRDDTQIGLSNLAQLVFKSSSIFGVNLSISSDPSEFKQVESEYTIFDGIDQTGSAIQEVLSGEAKGYTIVSVMSQGQSRMIEGMKQSGQLQPKL